MPKEESKPTLSEQLATPKWQFLRRSAKTKYLQRTFLASTVHLQPMDVKWATWDNVHRYFVSIAMSMMQYNTQRKAEGKSPVSANLFGAPVAKVELDATSESSPPALLSPVDSG